MDNPHHYKRPYPEFDARICGSMAAVDFGRMYAANNGLDQEHTGRAAINIAARLGGDLAWVKDNEVWISFAGAMYVTNKLDTAKVMGRLRKPDGSTSYR